MRNEQNSTQKILERMEKENIVVMYRLGIDNPNTRDLRNAIISFADKTLEIHVLIKIVRRFGEKTKCLIQLGLEIVELGKV